MERHKVYRRAASTPGHRYCAYRSRKRIMRFPSNRYQHAPDVSMILTAITFIIGIALLIKGAGLFVDGGSGLALRYSISPALIGSTIIAFGTSLPELVVSTDAAATGNTAIALGNVLGSNIANIALILALCTLIRPDMVAASGDVAPRAHPEHHVDVRCDSNVCPVRSRGNSAPLPEWSSSSSLPVSSSFLCGQDEKRQVPISDPAGDRCLIILAYRRRYRLAWSSRAPL